MKVPLNLSADQLSRQKDAPVAVLDGTSFWLFRDIVVNAGRVGAILPEQVDELLLHVKHVVLKRERQLSRIRRQVSAFENLDRLSGARRQKIPESVRMFVWQRDEGKCVRCGSRENLEFDHIIPVADGGGSTERNVQLLCETCNRQNGRTVG